MFNIYLGIYIVLAALVLLGGTMKLYQMELTVTALFYFIGALYILLVYGIRWFSKGGSLAGTPVAWPPTINTCPDFLTYYKKEDGSDNCIDTIGVSKNGTLKLFPKDGTVPTDSSYYFPLKTTESDPVKKYNVLCQSAMAMGLTWEGVTNGESCTYTPTPTDDSSSSSPGSCPPTFSLF